MPRRFRHDSKQRTSKQVGEDDLMPFRGSSNQRSSSLSTPSVHVCVIISNSNFRGGRPSSRRGTGTWGQRDEIIHPNNSLKRRLRYQTKGDPMLGDIPPTTPHKGTFQRQYLPQSLFTFRYKIKENPMLGDISPEYSSRRYVSAPVPSSIVIYI